jgi:hypothetical protein
MPSFATGRSLRFGGSARQAGQRLFPGFLLVRVTGNRFCSTCRRGKLLGVSRKLMKKRKKSVGERSRGGMG